MIVIIDYETGNLGSIRNMMKKIGCEAKISSSLLDIENASKLILPGVGAYDSGMTKLHSKEMIPVLHKKVIEDKIPILGLCLGMQLMTKKSEEGKIEGLGWIEAETVRFRFSETQKQFKVPHMGWKFVSQKMENPLFKDMYESSRFYFVHSYYVRCENANDILATTSYSEEFVSAFCKGNIMGVQFHPEKSHKYGMKMLKNFSEM
ncbi:MAG TPA: imidazole glycerol phosphate synthase subunit HisH [Bacteroidia bacterium]|nr:imidazole glycerol phosphate synthase subunit HisH [Bacteroidia bacterium]